MNEEELINEIARLEEELNEIRNKKINKLYKSLVGKFFKLKNSYSFSGNEDDYWYIYTYISSYTDDDGLKGFTFFKDFVGEIRFDTDAFISGGTLGEEITMYEFSNALLDLTEEIDAILVGIIKNSRTK